MWAAQLSDCSRLDGATIDWDPISANTVNNMVSETLRSLVGAHMLLRDRCLAEALELVDIGDPFFLVDLLEFLQAPSGRGCAEGTMRTWLVRLRRMLAYVPHVHPGRTTAVGCTWDRLQEWLAGPVMRRALPAGASAGQSRGRAKQLRQVWPLWGRLSSAVKQLVRQCCEAVDAQMSGLPESAADEPDEDQKHLAWMTQMAVLLCFLGFSVPPVRSGVLSTLLMPEAERCMFPGCCDARCRGNRIFACHSDAPELAGDPSLLLAITNDPAGVVGAHYVHYKNAGKGDFTGDLRRVVTLPRAFGTLFQKALKLYLDWGRGVLMSGQPGTQAAHQFIFVNRKGTPLRRFEPRLPPAACYGVPLAKRPLRSSLVRGFIGRA